ncbi:sugar transporter SWEET1 [Stomoxys calcitrans]|uniref:Sugar transporter SWEET n=1 Tax=Stomoxys calcitrans TaxID=35570 RepID=A0A1I8PCN7_STOCA|nr:sugar transporter SWEET1 [Stomoxys calcitrans]
MQSLENLVTLLETTAVVSTIFQYLSGALICRKYIAKKSTGDSSGFPFICGFLSCSYWVHYGMLSNEHSVVLVNCVGVTLFLIYTLIYYVFTVNKNAYVKLFLFVLTALFGIVFYINTIPEPAQAQNFMGIVCLIVTVTFFAAPLANLLHVIRVKNSESMPFPLIVMSFLVSVQWLIYGIIISDTFIQLPNFLGCVLSLVQLGLFVCYPPKSFSGQGYKLVDQSVVF